MFKAIKEFFFGAPTPAPKVEESKVEAVNAAPYKIEAPVAPAVEAKPATCTKSEVKCTETIKSRIECDFTNLETSYAALASAAAKSYGSDLKTAGTGNIQADFDKFAESRNMKAVRDSTYV